MLCGLLFAVAVSATARFNTAVDGPDCECIGKAQGPDCECIGKTQKKGPDCECIGKAQGPDCECIGAKPKTVLLKGEKKGPDCECIGKTQGPDCECIGKTQKKGPDCECIGKTQGPDCECIGAKPKTVLLKAEKGPDCECIGKTQGPDCECIGKTEKKGPDCECIGKTQGPDCECIGAKPKTVLVAAKKGPDCECIGKTQGPDCECIGKTQKKGPDCECIGKTQGPDCECIGKATKTVSLLQVGRREDPPPEDQLAKEMTHDLEMNFNKIAPFGKEDTAKELQDHAADTQDTLVDAVENAEVAEIKRAVFRALTRLRAATIKEFDTIARLETQAIDAYNDAHHYRAENPLSHLHEDEAPVETDKLKSFH
jgi:hypothetical protein